MGVTVSSISAPNTQNEAGHYLHDWYKTPYASPYYARNADNATIPEALQDAFDSKKQRYVDQVRAVASARVARRNDRARSRHNRRRAVRRSAGIRRDGLAAAGRVRAGLFTRGQAAGGTRPGGHLRGVRLRHHGCGVHGRAKHHRGPAVGEFSSGGRGRLGGARYPAGSRRARRSNSSSSDKLPGIAYLSTAAWEGLIRRLLHSMLTADNYFYVVLAGTTGTYRANNLWQSQVMQFNHIMEPVFDKLGMLLISRHMGMDAPTTVSALGGADVYGEADIFWHVVPEGEEETAGQVDLLLKQAILSGERMPVLLTPYNATRLRAADAWIGNVQPGADFCAPTRAENVPPVPACRYVNCDPDSAALCDTHSSVCWVARSDQSPPYEKYMLKNVGSQHKGYPSDRQQRLEGRKLAMLVLHALDEALDRWIEQDTQDVRPLPNELWHVGPASEELRERVRTLEETTSGGGGSACESFLRRLDPRICHMQMHVSGDALVMCLL